MSHRSRRIALLGKQIAEWGPQNQNDSNEDEDKENISGHSEIFEPISNWVWEVDPEVLRTSSSFHDPEEIQTKINSESKWGEMVHKLNYKSLSGEEPDIQTKSIEYSPKPLSDTTESIPEKILNEGVKEEIQLTSPDEKQNIPNKYSNVEKSPMHKTNCGKIIVISDHLVRKSWPEITEKCTTPRNDVMDTEPLILGQPKENIIEQPVPNNQLVELSAVNLHKEAMVNFPISQEQLVTSKEVPSIGEDHALHLVLVPPKEDVINLPVPDDELIILEEVPYDPNDLDYRWKQSTLLETSENTINSTPMETVSNSFRWGEEIKSEVLHESHDNLSSTPNKNIDDAKISMNNNGSHSKEVEAEVESAQRKNYMDRRDFCFFCEKDVSHFARHMFTWHESEIEIQRILACENNSKKRRDALSTLRKKGNFVRNRTNIKLRPVKRAQSFSILPASDYLPCPYCLGFYKKSSLYRHTKRCHENTSPGKKRQNAQSQGQTTLLLGSLIKHDELLKKELFPRMRADEISLIAKKDTLICNYGYPYIKGRRSKGNLDVVRQNMRRLSRLLKFARNENSEIISLIDLLRPSFFQTIVAGVNEIACYNAETDTYESPTVAVNFGTLIKKCCDLAYIHLLQIPDTNDKRKELKILKTLIESQWANEVSAQALNNLNTKKWNKDDLIPLTSDLMNLNNFLLKTSDEMYDKLLLDENNYSAYNTLKEVLYTQIILLNRRRPAEVAQLKVQTYKSVNLDSRDKTEFEDCLTQTERMLLSYYSRIVVRGKRGRGVPILLSPNMRKHFDCLVKIRNNFISNNDYVFHTNGVNFIDGTKVLYKYAQKCGVQRPMSISATRLRKHLATVTQLLQFSEKDLEQLSKFMGHTMKIHCNFYRLSDSLYQTAKVSKLLLLATEGGVEQYKGMQLDDINIDMNPITQGNENLNDSICEVIESSNEIHAESISISKDDAKKDSIELPKEKKKVPMQKKPWTQQQKNIISNYFSNHIKRKQAPKKHEIEDFLAEYPEMFKGRNWTIIKAVVFNMYSGHLKN